MEKNLDEARRKDPALTSASTTEPAADVVERDSGYYDILVIGRTGMGKSSTADKLMIPNTQECTEIKGDQFKKPLEEGVQEPVGQKDLEQSDTIIKFENLTALNDPEDKNNIEKRLKNIVTNRNISSQKPAGEQESQFEMHFTHSSSTRTCQLLKNNDSKIRVVDPPGFYGYSLMEGATSADNSNLIIVRQIFRIQATENLKFNRVLYFLPQNGPLTRADRALHEEIQQLVKFFGLSIFKCMVLVCTIAPHISRNPDLHVDKFPLELREQSKHYFYDILEREFKQQKEDITELPKPPIIFIALTDTPEEILQTVKTAQVSSDVPFQLKFNSKICHKCGIETGITNGAMVCEYRELGKIPWANAEVSNETFCHPIMSNSYLQGLKDNYWPPWRSNEWRLSEKVCKHCKKRAGEKGCWKVNTEFSSHADEKITVKHTTGLNH